MRQVGPLLIVLFGLLLRLGWIATHYDELAVDTDAYWRLADNVAVGRGLVTSADANATAYRPPLFPLILGGICVAFHDPLLGLGLLNATCGAITILVTIALGCHLGLGHWGRLVPGLLVAVDPLMLKYSSQAMTETFFTALMMLWLFALIRWKEQSATAELKSSVSYAILTGLIFGLMALTRPSLWPVVGLLGLVSLSRLLRGLMRSKQCALMLACSLTTFCIVLPWMVRNQLMLGSPILMTTHGGYTLILGNNPSFHQAVIGRPWGTTWSGESPIDAENQAVWVQTLQSEMRAAGIQGEVAEDRWMSKYAWIKIIEQPALFVKSAFRRQVRFWALAPLGPAAAGLNPIIWWGVAIFSGLLIGSALIGVSRLILSERIALLNSPWFPVLAVIVTFCCVHLFYWANTRMRLPIEPLLALLAMRSWVSSTSGAACRVTCTPPATVAQSPE